MADKRLFRRLHLGQRGALRAQGVHGWRAASRSAASAAGTSFELGGVGGSARWRNICDHRLFGRVGHQLGSRS
jgi:hypothetical protein